MNPAYFGDSYDLVKRFFCRELSLLGYSVVVDPMLTGTWSENEAEFYRLIGAARVDRQKQVSQRSALFLDPDTGINRRGGKHHASFDRLVRESANYDLVFAFDQSFSRQAKAADLMNEKLSTLRARGCYGMYYDSHARFVFVATERSALNELQFHLVSLGLPESRLLTADA
jgi:hypothetical protein